MKKRISKYLSSESKRKIKDFKSRLVSLFKKSPSFQKSLLFEKKMIIFGTPIHGNLGDHAIAKAQVEFLNLNFPGYKILEVPTDDIFDEIHHLKKLITDKDLIFFLGGGNLGDLYMFEEISRREVFKVLKETPIIHFPQSATFISGELMSKEVQISKKIYASKGKRLTIIGRESRSFKKFQEIFSANNVLYTPDIVLTLNERKEMKRNGILLCLRIDSEKVISEENKSLMLEALKEKYDEVNLTDTVVRYNVYEKTRAAELEKKWDEYRKCKVVITDRLHGMIFAVLTGTPCIVFDNYNSKVKKTYQDWLIGYKNIKFVDVLNDFSVSGILEMIDEIEDGEVPPFKLDEKYNPLLREIKKNIL